MRSRRLVGLSAVAIGLGVGCVQILGLQEAVLDTSLCSDPVTGYVVPCPPDGGAGASTGASSASASSTGSGTNCTPSMPIACVGANTLELCDQAGTGYESVTCALGCSPSPDPHCAQVVPTGIAPVEDFNAAGLADTTLDTANIVHTDTGLIEGGMRVASSNPTALSVASGIGFHVVTSGGNSVGVFVFDKLNVTGAPLVIVGTHPAVFLANGDVTIAAISVAADQTTNTPGPGGFAGGTPTTPNGLGPGGGIGGNWNVFFGGAGGAGHGDHGGMGATLMSATGGAGGLPYDALTLAVLTGGSGGGASATGTSTGGAGGGALQIVSQTSITIVGGIAAGGAGGRGNMDDSCGGGGAGGDILLESMAISVGNAGYLVAGGGGGGGVTNGNAAGSGNTESLAGGGGTCSLGICGGQGAYSGQTFGSDGTVGGQTAGCGGGAAGRIRINTLTGAALLSATSSLYVPSSMSGLLTQGVATIQ